MWNDDENDELLARALEESRRYYIEYEEPRLSQLHAENNGPVAGPSTSRAFPAPAVSGPSTSKALPFPSPERPSTEASNGEHTKTACRTLNDGQRKSSDQFYYGSDAEGFCLSEGKHWVYPTNDKFPIRIYQKSIVEKALFNNTLVSLPTGLGKTFIAAVVMYNFYRWYPKGKIIFMAPTKPLVAQQIDNCCNIMGIPRSHTAEMTGAMHAKARAVIWREKNVFFLTPQIVQNDLSAGICPASDVKCVVIDEAHRAVGDYAYTMVIRSLNSYDARFRVLALSATPGSDLQAVQKVVSNLMINHIELRNERSPDLLQYTHQRNVEVMVVQVGPTILRIQDKYLEIIQTYASRLQLRKFLFGNVKTMARFSCLRQWEDFRREGALNMDHATVNQFNSDFAVVCALIQGMELLQTYGLRLLLNHLKGIMNSKGNDVVSNRLGANLTVLELMEEIALILDPVDTDTQNEAPKKKNIIYGHPKLDRLHQVVVSHFEEYERKGSSTRAIIFCEYREGVMEINDMLKNFEPLVKPVSFMGQASGKTSKGITQKQQLEIMEKFRRGTYNTLVSTSVGEEGLDIGEVDLIICFDAKNSPIRQVQRMGRTGRKREGRIIMLMTQGKEERKYKESLWKKHNVNSALLSAESLAGFLYDECPRMLPPGVEPKYVERAIEIAPKKFQSGQQDLRKMFSRKPSAAATSGGKNAPRISHLSEEELKSLEDSWNVQKCCEFNRLPSRDEMWIKIIDGNDDFENADALDLSQYLEFLRFEQRTHVVGNSSDSRMLVNLLAWAEDRRDREDGTQCAVYARDVTSTQIWPSKGKKRSRAIAGMTDDKEDRPAKVRKKGRPKKTINNIRDERESPEPPLEELSNEFVKPKRPQFIEDEDEPSSTVNIPSPTHTGTSPKAMPFEVTVDPPADFPVVLDSDGEDSLSATPDLMLFGSQLSRKNLISGLMKALDRQLESEADDCDICDNLFPCQSINSLIIQNNVPARNLSWTKVRLSLQAASKLLPAMTESNMKKFYAKELKSPSQEQDLDALIPRNDDFYADDFDGGLLCGGLGDCSPPDWSERKLDQSDPVNVMPPNITPPNAMSESTDQRSFVKVCLEDSMPMKISSHVNSNTAEIISYPSDKEKQNDMATRYGKVPCSSNTISSESLKKEENVSQHRNGNLKDSSLQNIMDDSFDFLGLSKFEDIFEPQCSGIFRSTTKEQCGSTEKTALVDKCMSSGEKSLSSSKLVSPSGGDVTDSSQVSPILGSQMKRRSRPRRRIRKLSLGFCDQKLSTDTGGACDLSKTELGISTIAAPNETAAPSICETMEPSASPVCDFNICDDSLFELSQNSELEASKTSKIDESVKEAVRIKALEVMSKPPRTLTQQFRDVFDSSCSGFTQVLDLMDIKANKKSPDHKISRADSSSLVESETIKTAPDQPVENNQARSPDLFDDDFCFDGCLVESSVTTLAREIQDAGTSDMKPDCDISKNNEKTGRSTFNSDKCESDVKQRNIFPYPKKSTFPVFPQIAIVKKASKLSLKKHKINLCSSSTITNEELDASLVHKKNNIVEKEHPRIEAKLTNGVSYPDLSSLGDEFNNTWFSPLNEGMCEKYPPEMNPQLKDGTEISTVKASDFVHKKDACEEDKETHCNEKQDKTFLPIAHKVEASKTDEPLKNEFDLALEELDALKKKKNSKRLSLSRVSSLSNSKINHQSAKISDVVKYEKVITLDDDSPVKVPCRKKSTALNITTSSEEEYNSVDCDKKIGSDDKENKSFQCERKRRRMSSSSSDDLEAKGWLCTKKKTEFFKNKTKERRQQVNNPVKRENSFFDLSTFCDDSLLSPLKEDKGFNKQESTSKEWKDVGVHKNNHLDFKFQNGVQKKRRKKKKKNGLNNKCAFVESEAEESDDGADNSSDEECRSLDDMDSSFIDDEDSPPVATQSVLDMHAKYLESVKSPARGAGFKIPRNVRPVDLNVYSQYPEPSESYANDSFCVDDEPTQYEDNDMSLLEIAEARLKAKRKEKRKQRWKKDRSPQHNKEQESRISDECVEVVKPSKKRRIVILEDSDSDDGVAKEPAPSNVFVLKETEAKGNSVNKVNHNEFADLLEDDTDFDFCLDPDFPSICGASSSMSTSSPIRPPAFVKKSRVMLGRDVSHPARDENTPLLSHQHCDAAIELSKKNIAPQPLTRVSCTIPGASSTNRHLPTTNAQAQGVSTSSSSSVIVSSKQVGSYPELIRVLRVDHSIAIIPRTLPYVDFIVSWRLGISRTFVSDLKERKKLEELARNLKDYFTKPFLIVEKNKVKSLATGFHSKKKSNCDSAPKALWTSAHCSSMALLRQAGIQLLFAQDQVETAGLVARLANKENDKGFGIQPLSNNLSDDVENRLQFYSSLPCINFGLALKLLASYPSISEFLAKCSSVCEIASTVGVEITAARKIHNMLCEVHVNP